MNVRKLDICTNFYFDVLKAHTISYSRIKIFKVKGQENQVLANISFPMLHMSLDIIIKLVNYKILYKFDLIHFFVRSAVLEIYPEEWETGKRI